MRNLILTLRVYACKFTENPSFILSVSNGKVSIANGYAKGSFVTDCQEIVSRNNLSYGIIYGTKSSQTVSLIVKCSFEFNKDVKQQIRNVWSFY